MPETFLAERAPGLKFDGHETTLRPVSQGQLLANLDSAKSVSKAGVTTNRLAGTADTRLGNGLSVESATEQDRRASRLPVSPGPHLGLSLSGLRQSPVFDLAYAKHLIEHEQVAMARSHLERAIGQHPHDQRLLALQRAIAPGRVKRHAVLYRDRKSEAAWIQAHRPQYRGKWVALLGDQVLGIGDNLQTVLRLAHEYSPDEPPLLHHFAD